MNINNLCNWCRYHAHMTDAEYDCYIFNTLNDPPIVEAAIIDEPISNNNSSGNLTSLQLKSSLPKATPIKIARSTLLRQSDASFNDQQQTCGR